MGMSRLHKGMTYQRFCKLVKLCPVSISLGLDDVDAADGLGYLP